MTQSEAYDQVVQLAREYALIYQAGGGVAIIIHPDTQQEEGLWEHIQWVHGKGKHPKTIARETFEETCQNET